jgi:helicase
LSGRSLAEIAASSNLAVDDLLGVHARVLTLGLQTVVEQGIALLGKLRESKAHTLSPAVELL